MRGKELHVIRKASCIKRKKRTMNLFVYYMMEKGNKPENIS